MLEIRNAEGIAPAFQVLIDPASSSWRLFLACFLVLVASSVQEIRADTLWTGPNIEFTQSADDFADVLIPGAVSLTRDYNQWLFNPDAGDTGPATGTPTDTLWAFGTIDNYLGLNYQTFDSYRDGDLSSLLQGNPMVVQLVNEHIYLSLTFSSWPQHGGFFAYTRSTPAPETITNPTLTNGLFGFDYTASPGLSYVVQRSTNLVSWVSVATNVPASSPAHFTDNLTAGGRRYYRVGRQPIPAGAQ